MFVEGSGDVVFAKVMLEGDGCLSRIEAPQMWHFQNNVWMVVVW